MRAVFFDLDGTLLHFRRDYRDILADAVRDVIGQAPEDMLERYNEAFYAHFVALDYGPVRAAFASLELEAEPETLADALLAQEIAACEPPANAETDIARLADSHRLGVLTNGVREWQVEKLRATGLDGYFDTVVASYEAGAHKPAPAPFSLAEQRLPADAYAMVGDDAVDIEGAAAAGWAAFQYDGDGFEALPDAIKWD